MLLSILFGISVGHAEEGLEDLRIFVEGMVCSFCVQGVEKKFKKQEAVERVVVDLEDSVVSVWLKQDQNLTDNSIDKIIKDSGYDVESIERINKEALDHSQAKDEAKEKNQPKETSEPINKETKKK